MKSFREYMQGKLNESSQGAPVLEFQNVQFRFPFTQDRDVEFNGNITAPLTNKAVMDVKMANGGNIGKESIMSFVVENGTKTLDLLDADFAGSFRPNIDDLESYPDSLYQELAAVLADKIDSENFEVKNV
jgi:hypothetical protein